MFNSVHLVPCWTSDYNLVDRENEIRFVFVFFTTNPTQFSILFIKSERPKCTERISVPEDTYFVWNTWPQKVLQANMDRTVHLLGPEWIPIFRCTTITDIFFCDLQEFVISSVSKTFPHHL